MSSFCGRTCGTDATGNFSIENCGSCPWGWKANWPASVHDIDECSLCVKCTDSFSVYDWLFIVFNMLMIFLIHVQAIFRFSVQTYGNLLLELLCVLLEVILGFMVSVIIFSPIGALNITSCYNSSDLTMRYWYYFLQSGNSYSSFFDPFQGDIENLSCIYETVYPRYSLILSGFCLSFFFTLSLRPVFNYYTSSRRQLQAIPLPLQYAAFSSALLTLPIYIIFFLLSAGILYFSFGYIVMLFSVMGISLYSSLATPNNFNCMVNFKSSIKHLPAVASHLTLLLFALWTMLSSSAESNYLVLLTATVPLVFLLLTESMTHPHVQVAERDWHNEQLEG